MDFSTRQDDSRRRWTGFAAVVLFHLLLGWALMNGLARKVADSVSVLVETRIIEEVKPPPPPPPPPPVKPAAPKPVVAPKTVATAPQKTEPAPPQRAPAQASPVPMPAAAPPEAAPAPVVREAAPAPAAPPKPVGPVAAGIACSRTPPPQAPSVSSEVRGSIFVIGTLKGGRVVQVEVERTSLKGVTDRRVMRAFVQAIETAMKEGYVCVGDDVQIRQEFYFDIR